MHIHTYVYTHANIYTYMCVGGKHQFSGHIAGGTHHAFYDYGEGFCVFSDIAVACNVVSHYTHE